jgi:4-amino-4-deoxy-L-arabinose transferase-like glycosyltransferase
MTTTFKQVFLISLILFSIGFTSSFFRDLWEPDEPRFALVAREMINSGNFVMPHRNNRPYPDKPPLLFWAIAGFSTVTGGVNSVSALLPSALSLAISILLVFLIAKKLTKNENMAFLASVVFATAFKPYWQGTHAQIDMLLSCLVYGSVYFVLKFFEDKRLKNLYLFYFLMGLAVLAKGPVGFIIPLGTVLLYRYFKKESVKEVLNFKGIFIMLFVVGVWLTLLIVQSVANGEIDYLKNILFKQTVVRYAKSWHHKQPFYYFFKVILYDFFPWSPFLIAYFVKQFKEKEYFKKDLFIFVWFLFTMLFFSIPSGKRGLYILPMYPAVALMVGILIYKEKLNSLYLVIPSVFVGIIYMLAGIFLIFKKNKLPVPENVQLNVLIPAVLFLLCGILILILKNKRFEVIAVTQIVIYSYISFVAFPAMNVNNSARQFVKQNIKIMGQKGKLAIGQYRSAHVFYGDRNLIEFGGINEEDNLKQVAKFLKQGNNNFAIVKEKSLNTLKKIGLNIIVLNKRRVGNKVLCLVKTNSSDALED